jgi:hypothetical protein
MALRGVWTTLREHLFERLRSNHVELDGALERAAMGGT